MYASGNGEAVGINPSSSCSRTVGATLSAGSLAALRTSARKLGTGTQLYLHNGYNINEDVCPLALPLPAVQKYKDCEQHCTILNTMLVSFPCADGLGVRLYTTHSYQDERLLQPSYDATRPPPACSMAGPVA